MQDSVKREVFASDFRDRVVHHLYYNYVSPLFDRQFIYDSYSCRKGKGTLLGIERLEHHVRSVSRNYTREAYILKMDIRGYFMSINRNLLREMVYEMINRVHLPERNKDIVMYLTDIITLKNPLQGAKIRGNPDDWDDLPPSKCLKCSAPGVGLPIGDLTSQLFSNVFLNQLDWYVNSTLKFKHYGRYVDDFYIVDNNCQRLKSVIPQIAWILHSLGLELHPKKIRLHNVEKPTCFLGAIVFPFYRHCSSGTMHKFMMCKRAYKHMVGNAFDATQLDVGRCLSSMNSYYGYLKHFKAIKQKCDISR